MRSRMRNGMSLTQDCLYLVQITLTKLQQCRKHRKKMGRIEFTALGETSPNGQIVAFRVQGQVQTCDPTTSSTLGQYQRLTANVSVQRSHFLESSSNLGRCGSTTQRASSPR